MAYRPLYSGDLAGLNVAAADQERNATAARSGNQAFLQGLAQVAAARSGQASQERMGAADRESRMAMAQLADATNRYSTDTNAALGRQRNANDLLSSIQRNEQALAQLMTERDRIAALERQGIATNQLDKDKLAKATQQIADELKNRLEIARLQFGPDNLKVDPRVQNEILGQNAEIDDFNSRAASFADVLNSRTKSSTLGFGGVTPEDTFKTLTPEEAMLVQVTEDPVTKTRKFVARQRARLAMPSLTRPGSQASATNATAQTNSPSKVREFDWRALVPQAAAQAPSQSSPENYLSALASIAGSKNNQRAVSMEPAVARGEDLMSGPAIQSLIQYLNAPTPQAPVEPVEAYIPQGPPQRLYDPRRSIPRGATKWPDYNPAQGLYADPSGRVFRIPVSTTGQY